MSLIHSKLCLTLAFAAMSLVGNSARIFVLFLLVEVFPKLLRVRYFDMRQESRRLAGNVTTRTEDVGFRAFELDGAPDLCLVKVSRLS